MPTCQHPGCVGRHQLRYVTETNASLSCQTWKEYLYDALKLEPRIRFMQRMQEDGSAAFCLSSCDSWCDYVVTTYCQRISIFKYPLAEAYRYVNVLVSLLANSQHGIMDLKILIWYIRGHQPLSTKVLVVQRLIQEEHVQMLRFPPAKPKTSIWWTTHEHMCQHHHCFVFALSPIASKTSISTDNWACWIPYCQHACVFINKICWSLPQANESDSGYNALRPLGEDFEDLPKIKAWILIVLKKIVTGECWLPFYFLQRRHVQAMVASWFHEIACINEFFLHQNDLHCFCPYH